MGRQYNYYISPRQDELLVRWLFGNGFSILEAKKSLKESNDIIWDLQEITVDRFKQELPYKTFIYKKEWGKINKSYEKYSDITMKNPIIEQIHCLETDDYFLTRGRIYMDTYYKNEIPEFEIVYKEYTKLTRFIRKYIDCKQYILADGRKIFFPISKEAVNMLENGYKIGS